MFNSIFNIINEGLKILIFFFFMIFLVRYSQTQIVTGIWNLLVGWGLKFESSIIKKKIYIEVTISLGVVASIWDM